MSRPWKRWLRIAAEFAAMFGALVLVDHLVLGGTGYAHVQPNPYWIPVLVLALAYGTEAGLLAAMTASWIWLAHARSIATSGDYLDRLLQLSLTPLLWFLVAALVGEVTILRVRRHARRAYEADIAERNVERLSFAYQDLVATNRALQVRIAVEEKTIGRVVTLATELSECDSAGRNRAIVELVTLAARTADFTCYRLDDDGGMRVWLRGAAIETRPDILPRPLIAALRRPGRPLCVVRVDDRALLGDIGVAALALVPPGSSASIGCLVLHSLPFTSLNTNALTEIAEIGDWLPRLIVGDAPTVAGAAKRVGHRA
ncbi:MAG: hypothetical protein V4537_08220 [Pseudomonadota bacterium]